MLESMAFFIGAYCKEYNSELLLLSCRLFIDFLVFFTSLHWLVELDVFDHSDWSWTWNLRLVAWIQRTLFSARMRMVEIQAHA